MNDETKAVLEDWRRRVERHGDPVYYEERLILAHIDGEPARQAAAREEAIKEWRMYTVKEWEEDCQRRIAAAGEKMRAERDALQMRAEELLACTTAAEDYAKTVTVERDALREEVEVELHNAGFSVDDGLTTTIRNAADELRTLRARVVELEREREGLLMGGVTVEARQQLERAEKAEARVAELEAQMEAQRASSQRHMNGRESYWIEQRRKWIAEHDRYAESCKWHADRAERAEAQVAAARAMCEQIRFGEFASHYGRSHAAADVLRAVDEAGKEKL